MAEKPSGEKLVAANRKSFPRVLHPGKAGGRHCPAWHRGQGHSGRPFEPERQLCTDPVGRSFPVQLSHQPIFPREYREPRSDALAKTPAAPKRNSKADTKNAGEKGSTLVPLRVYLKQGRIKVELGVAKGKKLIDKRETERRKEADREAMSAMKHRR